MEMYIWIHYPMTQSTGLSSWANDRRYISHILSSLESSLCIIQGMPVEAAYIFPNLKIIMVGISFLWPPVKVQVSSHGTRFVKFSSVYIYIYICVCACILCVCAHIFSLIYLCIYWLISICIDMYIYTAHALTCICIYIYI